MQKSHFMWLRQGKSTGQELSLSSEVSEWLFYIGYWHQLSLEHALQYEQYEEEVMPSAKIPSAVERLESAAQAVQGPIAASVRFTYGWDANRQALECATSPGEIFAELDRLVAFLTGAQAASLDVYCQL